MKNENNNKSNEKNNSINNNNINISQDNSFSSFIFNSYSDLNQVCEEEDDLSNKMNNLSINNTNNSNENNNINNNKFSSINNNISNSSNSNLASSKSTEFSSTICFPLSNNAEKIYEHIYEKKYNLKNSIIISDDEEINKEIYIKIIEDYYNYTNNNIINFNTIIDRNVNKICFLAVDSKKIDKLLEKLNEIFGKQKKIMILQGGKGKKMKNDYNKFIEFIKNTDIFIAIPDVFYKLLSIGFIKIFQFSILFIDDCHLCEGNHPYNIILQEFYYYYFYRESELKIKNNFSLPNIIGFTNSPFFDKRLINNDNKCKQLLVNISENLNSQMIISPKIFYQNFDENNVYIEYIQVENHLKDRNSFDKLYLVLSHYFIEKMLKLCLRNFLTQNKNIFLDNQNINNIGNNYLNITKQKFYSSSFEEYSKIEAMEKSLHFLSQGSYLFRIFEDIQKYLIIILQNIDIQGIINLFVKYLNLYQDFLNQKKIDDKNIINELNFLILMIKDCIKAFEHLLKKNFNFYNDRLNKFILYLNDIYSKRVDTKIIIFVPTRKLAYALNEYLNRNNLYKSEYIAGVNTKKEEYINLTLSTKITNNIINERNKKFNEDNNINILICTPSVYDIIQISKCDYIIIFNELSNSNSDYIRIKNLANNYKSKLIIFTLNQNYIRNIFMQKVIEHENKLMIFFEPNEIVKNFKRENYFEEKIQNIKKQNYYIIEETHAKVSIRNSMMLYNEINNWFLQQNIKLIAYKFIDEIFIDKIKKYKCKIELCEMFNNQKIFSHTYGDKQTSECDCILQLICFLHKVGMVDNNLKIIDKFK